MAFLPADVLAPFWSCGNLERAGFGSFCTRMHALLAGYARLWRSTSDSEAESLFSMRTCWSPSIL